MFNFITGLITGQLLGHTQTYDPNQSVYISPKTAKEVRLEIKQEEEIWKKALKSCKSRIVTKKEYYEIICDEHFYKNRTIIGKYKNKILEGEIFGELIFRIKNE